MLKSKVSIVKLIKGNNYRERSSGRVVAIALSLEQRILRINNHLIKNAIIKLSVNKEDLENRPRKKNNE